MLAKKVWCTRTHFGQWTVAVFLKFNILFKFQVLHMTGHPWTGKVPFLFKNNLLPPALSILILTVFPKPPHIHISIWPWVCVRWLCWHQNISHWSTSVYTPAGSGWLKFWGSGNPGLRPPCPCAPAPPSPTSLLPSTHPSFWKVITTTQ